jgi:hypothetical protein
VVWALSVKIAVFNDFCTLSGVTDTYQRALDRAKALKYRDKKLASGRAYYLSHRDECIERVSAWKKRHREKVRAYYKKRRLERLAYAKRPIVKARNNHLARERRAANLAKFLSRERRYRQNNRERINTKRKERWARLPAELKSLKRLCMTEEQRATERSSGRRNYRRHVEKEQLRNALARVRRAMPGMDTETIEKISRLRVSQSKLINAVIQPKKELSKWLLARKL